MNVLSKWLRDIGFIAKNGADVQKFVDTAKAMEAELRESEDLFRDLVEHSSDLICTHTLDGRLLSVNELPVRLLGYSREELVNKPMREFLLPEARAQFDESLLRIKKEGFVKGLMVVLTKTGERRIWEYHNTLRTNGVSTPIVRGIAHDVTDQKRMERALRLSEEKFSKAFRCSPTLLSITTFREGRFLEVNENFERQVGYAREEIIGHTALELNFWVDPCERDSLLGTVKRQGNVRDQEVHFRVSSGQTVVVLLSVELIELAGEQCLLTVGQDITERKRAQEELRRLSGQLLRLQDEERRKIARDLHDTTGQGLVALETTLGQLHALIPSNERKSRKLISQCRALSNRCIREVRTLSYILHPPMLDEAGLEDAIRHYANGFAERTGIELELDLSLDFGRMARDTELALFRVIQEGLSNIQRHSGSYTAKLRLDRTPSVVLLEVSDKGRGIPCSQRKRGIGIPLGVGIPSMHERVKLIGGRVEIESSSSGTTVRVTIPACQGSHEETQDFDS
jgi:PAS domain S-box-containing protein